MQIGLVKGRAFTPPMRRVLRPRRLSMRRSHKNFGQPDPSVENFNLASSIGSVRLWAWSRDIQDVPTSPPPRAADVRFLSAISFSDARFVVRTAGNATGMPTAIRNTIWSVDRDQPISSVEPLETLMAIVDSGNRVLTKLMLFFGDCLVFGSNRIYGVMSD